MAKKDSNQERLQKVMAHAGVASRRASERLIEQGRVSVNGRVVTEMGVKVDPRQDEIRVDGRLLDKQAEPTVYIILHKPRNVISTAEDQRGRRTVLDLVDVPERVYPVGRLDLLSEGLILLTNDGDLTKKLTHPSSHIEKEYHVLVTGLPTSQTLARWRAGKIAIEGDAAAQAGVDRMKIEGKNSWLRVILTEGRKRQIRVTAKALGHPVKTLRRVRIGPVKLGNLKLGNWRYLSQKEIERLKRAVS